MKIKVLFLSLLLVGSGLVLGQSVKPTNTYPSNLEENQYFDDEGGGF
jgi:hypothetical protein